MSVTFRGTFVSVVTQDITALLPTSALTLEGFVVMPEVIFLCYNYDSCIISKVL